MQTKFTKKFIYNWFKEDFHGEFTLFKLNNFLTHRFLNRTWDYLSKNRNRLTASLFGKIFLPIYMNYVSYTLRNQFLRIFTNNNKSIIQINKLPFNFKTRHFSVINLIKKYLLVTRIFNSYSTAKFTPKNNIVTSRIRYFIRKTMRIYSIRRRRLIKKKYLLRTSKTRINRTLRGCKKKYLFRARRYYLNNYKQKRPLNAKSIQKKRLILFKNRKKILITVRPPALWRHFFLLPFRTNKAILASPKTTPALLKTKVIRKFWDNLSYRLRKTNNWLSGRKSNVFNSHTRVRLAKFDFRGVFKKRTLYVKKHEISKLLQFRRFLKFHLIESPIETTRKYNFMLATAKKLTLPIFASFEYLLNTIILRSNFFQNGYIINTLLKRGMFLINGTPALNIAIVQPWDIITVKNPLWWVVYSRFLNFFSAFITQKALIFNLVDKKQLRQPSVFNKVGLNTKFNFLKRFIKNRRLLISGVAARFRSSSGLMLLKLQNYIFSLPPTYMEISFKLFIIIVFKILTLSSDQTRLFNVSSIQQLQPSAVLNLTVTS